MKKFLKHLLVGVVPFLSFEKSGAEPVDFVESYTPTGMVQNAFPNPETNANSEDTLKSFLSHQDRLAGVDQINEVLDLLDEMQSKNDSPSFDETALNTNNQVVVEGIPVSENVSFSENASNITNDVSSVQESSENPEPDVILVSDLPNVDTNSVPSIPEQSENTETNMIPVMVNDETTEEPSTDLYNHQEKSALNLEQNQSLDHRIPEEGKMGKFFDWLLIGLSAAGVSGILGKLVFAYSKSRRRNKSMRMATDYEELSYSPPLSREQPKEKSIPQKQEPTAPVPPRKKIIFSSKRKDKIKRPVIVLDENSRQKGIKMLANIKLRRTDINRQMKVLRQEIEKFHQSTPEWANIANQMSELTQERKKLALEARQARILVKGKQGELIKEERRLLAKEMRLAKKTNDAERINKIMFKRLAIKQQEKQILSEALKEVKKRQEEASKWQGIRLFQEVHSEEKALKERIKQLKKETGLKQKEILELEEDLNDQHKQIKAKKSLARKKVKGSFFTTRRRILSQQIIMAHNNDDSEGEDLLKQELQELKQTEKEHIKQVENSDYLSERRKKIKEIHPIVDKHVKVREAEEQKRKLQEQKRQAQKQHQAERDERALFLQGQRMLRDLSNGLSETVNLNQMTPQDYKKWAYGKIGKNWIDGFNYEKERASFLKPNVLAHIYLAKKKRGLVK